MNHFLSFFLVCFICFSSNAQTKCPLSGHEGYTYGINMVAHQARGVIQIAENGCGFSVLKFDVAGFRDLTWWAAEKLSLDSILAGFPLNSSLDLTRNHVNANDTVIIPEQDWDVLESVGVIALWVPSEARLVGYVVLGSEEKSLTMFDHCMKYTESSQVRWSVNLNQEQYELSSVEFAVEGHIAEEQYHSIGFPLHKDKIMGGADAIVYGLIDDQPFALDYFFPSYKECKESSPGKFGGVCRDLQLGQGKDMYDNVNLTYSHHVEGTWLITASRLLASTDRRFDLDINPFDPMYLLWAVSGFTTDSENLPMLKYHGVSHGMHNVTLMEGGHEEGLECELIYDPLAISTGSIHLIQDVSAPLKVTFGPKASINPLQPDSVLYINDSPSPTIIAKQGEELVFSAPEGLKMIITDSPLGGTYASSVFASGKGEVRWIVESGAGNTTEVFYQSIDNPLMGGKIMINTDSGEGQEEMQGPVLEWDALEVRWEFQGVGDDRAVTFDVQATKPVGWLCIGFGSMMKGGYAYIGWMDDSGEGMVKGYHMTGHKTSDVHLDEDAHFVDAMVERDGITNRLRLRFTRPLIAITAEERDIQEDTSMNMIWAYGSSWQLNNLVHANIHSARGIEQVNLATGESKSVPVAVIWLVHGVLMFFGWSVLVPFAVMVARYLKADLGPLWMTIHKFCNIFGLLVSTVGFGLAIYEIQVFGAEHFRTTHTKLGLAITVIGVYQGIQGFIRPAKPDANSKRSQHIKRNLWGIPHKFVGFSLIAMSIAAIITGLQALETKGSGDTIAWQIAVYAWILLLVLLALMLQFRLAVKVMKNKQKTKDVKQDNQKNNDTESEVSDKDVEKGETKDIEKEGSNNNDMESDASDKDVQKGESDAASSEQE